MGYHPIIIEAETLGEAWEKAVVSMMCNGFDRWVEAPEYKTTTKDCPMFIHVRSPMKEPRVSPKAPTSKEMLKEYAKNLIYGMGEKEKEFDYTYYSRLRCYPDCKVRAWLPNVTKSEEELKEEVRKISNGKCIVRRIDQVKKAIEIFKRDPTRRTVVMHTWIPMRDLEKFGPKREDTSSPCLVLVHPQLVENKLHFNVVMKTNDLFSAWPGNAFAFTELQRYMAERIGVEVGHYTHFSVSMQIYQEAYEAVKRSFDL